MRTDKHGNYLTVDGKEFYETNFGGWEWYSLFECYSEVSGGKFNIWLTNTKWPRKRWSEMARDFSSKLSYRWEGYARRMRVRGLKAQKNLEKMRHYYGIV